MQEQVKDKDIQADRAAYREVFAEIREQRNANPQLVIEEVTQCTTKYLM